MEIERSEARVSPLAEQVVDGCWARGGWDELLDGNGPKDGTASMVL